MAQSAALDGVEVVVLGDSIVEHFSGTWKMGLTPKVRSKDRDGGGDADGGGGDDRTEAHNEDAAEALATQAKAYAELRSKLNMVALGCSGDTTNQLLYHLMHGVLPPKLQPKVFVLMIGTNNLGPQWGCNARTTLAGILHVAQHLHKERPQATVVLHSLLPRTDADGEAGPLNRYWSQILWINLQLQKFSALHPEWRFTNPNSKLLRADKRAPYKVALKPGVMPDGLHPSPEGYEIWSRELTKVVARALEEHDKRQAKNEKDGGGRRKEQPARDRRRRGDAR
jgi:lysophospholipase L1-like esterase